HPRPRDDARQGARDRGGRRGIPQATLSEWEPPVDADDDSPIFSEGGAAASAPAERRRSGEEPRGGRGRRDANDRPRSESSPSSEEPIGEDFANIFLNVGRRDGLTADELIRMVGELAGIPASEMGRIRVRDRITFVAVKKELADRAMRALIGHSVGGRAVNAELARERP